MMSAIEDSQVATTSKDIQEGGIDEDAEMIDVEEEEKEEEELMVSSDNRSRKNVSKNINVLNNFPPLKKLKN